MARPSVAAAVVGVAEAPILVWRTRFAAAAAVGLPGVDDAGDAPAELLMLMAVSAGRGRLGVAASHGPPCTAAQAHTTGSRDSPSSVAASRSRSKAASPAASR